MAESEFQRTLCSPASAGDIVRVQKIPPAAVNIWWTDIEAWVESALGEDKTYTTPDIKKECEEAKWDLWLFFKGNDLMGFFISAILPLPKGKLFYGSWLGGKNLDEWVSEGMDITKAYARAHGCLAYSFIGRLAWKKLVGFDYTGVYYYQNL